MVALACGEVFGGRHALCSFDWGKYDTLVLWFFGLPVFNFHSLWPVPFLTLVTDGVFD